MKLMLATPFDGADMWTARVALGYHRFVIALHRELGAETLDGSLLFANDVCRARNRGAATVLREFPEMTHVLWLDDDNFPLDVAAGVQTVREMLELSDRWPVLGAAYTTKRDGPRWIHQYLPPPGTEVDADGVLAVRAVGFGFTLTTTNALRAVGAESGQLPGQAYYDLPNEHLVANLFGQVYDHDLQGRPFLASEDYSFCARWRGIGGKVGIYAKACLIGHAGARVYSALDIPGAVTPQVRS